MARAANLFKRGDIWYFRRVNPTTKKREAVSTGCKDPNQAKRRKSELEKEQNDNAFGWKTKAAPKLSTSVFAWTVEFRKTYLPKHKNPSAFEQALAHAANFFGHTNIDEVGSHECEQLLALLRRDDYATGTIRTYYSSLRCLWNTAKRAGYLTVNPWDDIDTDKGDPRSRVLRLSEQEKFFACVRTPMWLRAVKVCLLTGLREFELVGLKDEDVDFVQRQIKTIGKGGKLRYIPLAPECAVLLREQMGARDHGAAALEMRDRRYTKQRIADRFVFPATRDAFYQEVAAASKAAKLSPSLTVHDLRRTFGSRCAEARVPMKKLQQWMGHSDIRLTAQFYVHLGTASDIDDMAGLRASVAPKGVATELATAAAS